MENRSFNHMLGYLRLPKYGGNINVEGVQDDQAWLNAVANQWDGKSYQPGPLLEPRIPIRHTARKHSDATRPGRRERFSARRVYCECRRRLERNALSDAGQATNPDFFAHNFRICDHWFSPLPASTQPNRLMAMAGYSLIDGNVKVLPNDVLAYDWLNVHGVRLARSITRGFSRSSA